MPDTPKRVSNHIPARRSTWRNHCATAMKQYRVPIMAMTSMAIWASVIGVSLLQQCVSLQGEDVARLMLSNDKL